MSPYKIAIICDHFSPRIGGIEFHIRDLALALKSRGHEPQIITPFPGKAEVAGVKIHRVPASLLPGFKIIWNSKPFASLKTIIRKEKFDVVHAHSSVVSPFAYGSMYLCNRLNQPGVLTCHSLLEKSVFTFRALHRFYHWRDWPFIPSGVSQAAARGVERAAKGKKVAILSNGIHPENWKIELRPASGFQITTVSRLNKKKKVQDLIKAIPEILKQLPEDSKPLFNIIGKGPYQKRIEYLIRRYHLENYVNLTGYLDRSEIKKIFAQTDLFVLPTKKEAFGIAVLEARCAGLPVVAMNHGGVGDLIVEGQNGFLAKDRREFISQIAQVLKNQNLRDQFRQNTFQNIENFAWPQVLKQHEEIYGLAIQTISESPKRKERY